MLFFFHCFQTKLDMILKDFKMASSQTCNLTNSAEKAVDCMDSEFSVVNIITIM